MRFISRFGERRTSAIILEHVVRATRFTQIIAIENCIHSQTPRDKLFAGEMQWAEFKEKSQ